MRILAVAWYTDVLIVAAAIGTIGTAVAVLSGWGRGLGRCVRALRHRRPRRVAEAQAPSEEQVRVLNAVFEHFRSSGQRAGFSELDKELDLEGIQLRPAAESMPPGLLIPSIAARGGFFREDDRLMVAVGGLRYCEHGSEALDLLARSLAYLAKREKPFVPSEAQRELAISSAEIRRELRLSPTQLGQVHQMFDAYEAHACPRAWNDDGGSWGVVVATEYVRRFRGIRNGAEYARAREGESFAHQLDEEEAVPRFVLICEPPSSLALDSQPVVMRVENPGPSETFEATVIEITSAEAAPTPWHVRWRGSATESKEILSGGHWVLEIARQDALHGAKGSNWTPGFVFLQPDDREVFVASTGLGSTGSRYGVPMRVKIRVTPRSQPQRSLENVVTLQITEQGQGVLWDRHQVPVS